MIISTRRMVMTLAVALLGLLSFTIPVYAQGQNSSALQGRKPANLIIEPLKPFPLGDHPVINVQLTAEFGAPIPNQPIIIVMDGARRAAGRTDSRGVASIPLKYKFPAGTYHIVAIYPGIISIGVNRATAETDFIIEPAKIAIYTVPPVPGVKFKLNHDIFTSDENGVVELAVTTSGVYTLEVLPIDEDNLPSSTQLEFARWNDNVFTANRKVYFPRARKLEAGFIVNYQVDQLFYDTTGEPVDPARVSSMVIRGIGNTYTLDGAGPVWLPSNRLTRRIGERLESEEILYFFRDVTIDGANVINRSEQRFHINPNDTWPIQVLLYSVRVTARDAMFHFPIGKGVELTYPDGHMEKFLFDSDNAQVMIPSLARGSYSAKIIGAGGSAPPTPIYLSRDQDVELLMLSYLDIALIIGIPVAMALAFFFIGRPRWLQVVRHPSKYKELLYRNNSANISFKP
ncbi:MAG TPA: Ig-like domain-containing protein [Anaerolineales bacterium]|nr:Ig-like domain-containing protein [Anaerolineales bacterium]